MQRCTSTNTYTHKCAQAPNHCYNPQPHTQRQAVTASGSLSAGSRGEWDWRSRNTLSACLRLQSDRRATVYSLHRQPDSQRRRPFSPHPSSPPLTQPPNSQWQESGRANEGRKKEWRREKEGGSPPVCPSDLINGPLRHRDDTASLLPFPPVPHTQTHRAARRHSCLLSSPDITTTLIHLSFLYFQTFLHLCIFVCSQFSFYFLFSV